MGSQKLQIIPISQRRREHPPEKKVLDSAIHFFTKSMPKTYYHYFSIHNPPCRGGLDGLVETLTTKGLYILTTQVFLKLAFPIDRISSPRQTSKSWYRFARLSFKCCFAATRMYLGRATARPLQRSTQRVLIRLLEKLLPF